MIESKNSVTLPSHITFVSHIVMKNTPKGAKYISKHHHQINITLLLCQASTEVMSRPALLISIMIIRLYIFIVTHLLLCCSLSNTLILNDGVLSQPMHWQSHQCF